MEKVAQPETKDDLLMELTRDMIDRKLERKAAMKEFSDQIKDLERQIEDLVVKNQPRLI